MKKYKFLSNDMPKELSKLLNKHLEEGWKLEEWKVNDNVVVMLLSKEELEK